MLKHNNNTVYAPAKLIISGEYSVMYQLPAIAIPLDIGIYCQADWSDSKQLIINEYAQQKIISQAHFSWDNAEQIYQQITKRHNNFIENNETGKLILQDKYDLIISAVYKTMQYFNNFKKNSRGLIINYTNEIPIGSGVGSSAALGCAMVLAIKQLINKVGKPQKIYELICQIEDIAHGKSGRLDPWVCFNKQPVYWQKGKAQHNNINHFAKTIINTGQPHANTAECVTQVKQNFPINHPIWQKFADVTENIANILNTANSRVDMTALSKELYNNQQLLQQIGVIPQRIKQFIDYLNSQNIAAKISGAGSIRGHSAGIVIAVGDKKIINQAIKQYQFKKIEKD